MTSPVRTKGRLPNLIVIGAMKSGTSSLHYYLDEHPEIQMSSLKELRFFIAERNWSRGPDWYRSQFSPDVKVAGESSTGYSMHPQNPGVAGRMHGLIPDARLIYVVRDPIRRVVSDYIHLTVDGRERRPFEEAVWDESMNYLGRSMYFMQISQYLPFYSADQILVLTTTDLQQRRFETLRTVFQFLGVDDGFTSPQFAKERGRTSSKRKPTETGIKISKAIKRPLSLLPRRQASRLKHSLLLPFSRPVVRPQLSETILNQLRSSLEQDTQQFRDWSGLDLAEWSV